MLICVDLDGTLLDTVPANAASYRAALEELGFTVTDEYYAAHCNGGYYKDFLRPLMGGDPDPADVERVHDRKKALYADYLDCVRPNRALLELLQAMRPPATGWPVSPPAAAATSTRCSAISAVCAGLT